MPIDRAQDQDARDHRRARGNRGPGHGILDRPCGIRRRRDAPG
jgi:hypothetical protein